MKIYRLDSPGISEEEDAKAARASWKSNFQKLIAQIRWASTAICPQFTEASHVISYVEHFANVFSTPVVTKISVWSILQSR